MSATEAAIPYEKQSDPQASRMCGAACLSMVYRSFGKDIKQTEIWPVIAKPNQFGSLASTTHLMAKDALGRGLAAIAIQARHPLQALRLCHDAGIRAILNHRLQPDSATGHYTVMVDLDSNNVVVHDPSFGPSRSLSYVELFALWQPQFPNSEIAGNVLIAVAADPPPAPACQFCHTETPPSVECPRCKKPIVLRPAAVLGCMNPNCIARMWSHICCPACDFMLESESHSAKAGATGNPGVGDAPSPAAAVDDAAEPASLGQMFDSLDKFVEHVRNVPGIESNAEIQQQLQILAGSRASAKLALAEAAVHSQVQKSQLDAFEQATKERGDAIRKRKEEVNKPSPPLDGNALGRALLKNLGFTD
jgi:hypothetical protein